MIGTLTWHFHNCVISNEEDICPHAVYKEYENLEIMLNDIKRLQHRPFDKPDYILVEFNGIIYDVSKPDGIHTKELIIAMIESKYDEKNTQ